MYNRYHLQRFFPVLTPNQHVLTERNGSFILLSECLKTKDEDLK